MARASPSSTGAERSPSSTSPRSPCPGRAGDIHPGTIQGLFVLDTRLLSRLQLTIDGIAPEPLAVSADLPFAATFVARVQRLGAPEHESPLLVVRRRYVGAGMREDLTVRNHNRHDVRLNVRFEVESDFASLFAVKEGRAKPEGEQGYRIDGSRLHLTYRGDKVRREVTLVFEGDPLIEPGAASWQVRIPGGGEWSACFGVSLSLEGNGAPAPLRVR